jgi:hypothetical protein
MVASHINRNGFCTILIIWPAAAIILVAAALASGCAASCSAGEDGRYGRAGDG